MNLFEEVTGTKELYEALRRDGFQSLFVAQSEAREVSLRIDMSLLRAVCWTMALRDEACEPREISMRRGPKVRLVL